MSERDQILRLKRRLLSDRAEWAVPPEKFIAPTCGLCGTQAHFILEPDGACGDPECCPQSEHIEVVCPNRECEAIGEQLRYVARKP